MASPGIRREKLRPADRLVAELVERIVGDRGLIAGDRVVALVGSAGATPPMEVSIVCRALAAELGGRGIELLRLWQGPVMTSLDMAGFSITLLGVADDAQGTDILALLDSPTGALAWPGGSSAAIPELRLVPVPEPPPVPRLDSEHDHRTRVAIDAVCRALLDQEAELTRLDQVVGDGDLGTALARGARAWLQNPIDGSAAQLLRRLSEHARREIGGTSGPLYAAGLLRASEKLADGGDWPDAFIAGVAAIKELGGAALGDRTMIDALEPAAAAAGDGLAAATEAARAGAASTTDSVARRGRSSYLGDRVRGHPDPGAMAVVVWLSAIEDGSAHLRKGSS